MPASKQGEEIRERDDSKKQGANTKKKGGVIKK